MFLILVISLLKFSLTTSLALGDTCGIKSYPAPEVIRHFRSKSDDNDSKAKKIYHLLTIGRDIIGVKSYETCPSGTFEEVMKNFEEYIMKRAWIDQLATDPEWEKKKTDEAIRTLNLERDTLKNFFGPTSYGYAWVEKMTGDAAKAKSILIEVFEENYNSNMARTEVHRWTPGPFSEIERTYKALAPMLSRQEREDYEKRLKRVKIHISNLPDSGMLT